VVVGDVDGDDDGRTGTMSFGRRRMVIGMGVMRLSNELEWAIREHSQDHCARSACQATGRGEAWSATTRLDEGRFDCKLNYSNWLSI
jgi:hypothetical protein